MNNEMINDWRPETRSLINALKKAGFTIESGNNGEEDEDFKPSSFKTFNAFLEELLACDDARLYVKSPTGKLLGLYLVLGNSPGELVSDYHINPLLDTVVTAHYDKWEGRKQPLRKSPY